MTALTRFCIPVALFALAIVGCSDDDDAPNGGGTVDTTAPSVTSATAVDIRHIDVAFNEDVQRSSAEDETNYVIVEQPPVLQASAAPGDTLIVTLAALKPDGRTVTLSTFAMDAVPYEIVPGEILIGRDRYDLTEWNLTAEGRCRTCGTVLPGVLEESPGVWNGRRLPVKVGKSAA